MKGKPKQHKVKRGQRLPPVKRVRCEVYSRIVGYLRPVQNWAKHKQLEFEQRKNFVIETEEETK